MLSRRDGLAGREVVEKPNFVCVLRVSERQPPAHPYPPAASSNLAARANNRGQAYRRKLPDKRDVIYFRRSPVKGSTAVGCVAGVPGDMVATPAGAVKVPAESLWVVGHDPKEPTRGVMISAYAIIGKVTYRVWPLRRVGEILPIKA